jgi:D-alanyl-lipoteichoic acid acyltransferase DltB (MBOAT superfamily)
MAPLLLAATAVFYWLGIMLGHCVENVSVSRGGVASSSYGKKSALYTTVGVCLGVALLAFFKYLNFFVASFSALFSAFGLKTNPHTFNIILPLGISFFTFKLISYILEINRENIKPEKDFVNFALYVAFFPTIMAGPIDRPATFLPQLQEKRPFDCDLFADGCRQILYGLFKKAVIADSLNSEVSVIYDSFHVYQGGAYTGSTLLLAMFLYAFTMYADFSGYSDMAIGVGKILGLRITKHFNYPFFARNIAEFWRNWHISLTTWLTDYVFTPLCIQFRDAGKFGIILATIINFLLVGLWHGADLTFVIFGLIQGVLYIPLLLNGKFTRNKKIIPGIGGLPKLKDFCGMCLTFVLFSFSLIFLRAENLEQAFQYIGEICSPSLFAPLDIFNYIDGVVVILISILAVFVLVLEWINKDREYAMCFNAAIPKAMRFAIYFIALGFIYFFSGPTADVIYIQF